MSTIKTKWESTMPNPDEEHLKTLWMSEVKDLERSLAERKALAKQKKEQMLALIKGSGLNEKKIDEWIKESKEHSRKSLEAAEEQIARPPIDLKDMREKEMELMKAVGNQMKSQRDLHSNGIIFDPTYAGAWMNYEGESEEIPTYMLSVSNQRLDLRTQAWGEGWYDGDHSELHAYMGYRFTPPATGVLYVNPYIWMHGYYDLYSNDNCWVHEYAKAEVHTWVDFFQYYWPIGGRSYVNHFKKQGAEINPTFSGRIDKWYFHNHPATFVWANNPVTIRAGVKLYCRAKAGGSRAILDFRTGDANWVRIVGLIWSLHI